MIRSTRALAAAVSIVVLWAAPAAAETPQETATRLSKQIMSPFCPGATVYDCPSDTATDLREEIEVMARSGMDDEAILTRLEDEYGPNLSATPQGGAAWPAYGLPAAALVAGLAGILLAARRWSRTRPAHAEAAQPRPEDRARVERELATMREALRGPE